MADTAGAAQPLSAALKMAIFPIEIGSILNVSLHRFLCQNPLAKEHRRVSRFAAGPSCFCFRPVGTTHLGRSPEVRGTLRLLPQHHSG